MFSHGQCFQILKSFHASITYQARTELTAPLGRSHSSLRPLESMSLHVENEGVCKSVIEATGVQCIQ